MTNKISAGSYDLNRFLQGGYEKDIITTIYGPGGSGKSNFVMCVCVSQVKKGNKVLFIDTEGSFSVERFKQIHGGEKEEIDKSISNVLLLNPTNYSEQEECFEKINKYISKDEFSLIIVDSIGILYRLELSDAIETKNEENIKSVNRKMAKQLMVLNEIARKKNIPVVVTNQVYTSFSKDDNESSIRETNMVGGDLLKYWSKCLIELQNNFGRRKIILRKHRSLPEKEMFFEISDSGIKKRGIFT